MKQTEESLKIKSKIHESEQRRHHAKIQKARIEMLRQELEDMSRITKIANNFIFRNHQ